MPRPVTATGRIQPGEVADKRIIPKDDPGESRKLPCQRFPTHKIALERGKAHARLSQRNGKDGDVPPVPVRPVFMAVEGQAGLEAQGVPGRQTHGYGPLGDEKVPHPRSVGTIEEKFKADRFSRIPGPAGHHPGAGDGHDAQGISHGFGHPAGVDDLRQYPPRQRALERKHGHLHGAVDHFNFFK